MSKETHGWIRLKQLQVDGVRVGIYPHEKDGPQSVVFDVGLWAPVRPAANSERIDDTVDYDAVAELVRGVSRKRYYPLLEALCETTATALLHEFGVDRVAIEVTKPGALAPGAVSVAIERSR
ncbi:dihydroneopterin aldolase [Myxococcota bacterium]